MNWILKKSKYICAVLGTAVLMCACGDEIPELTPEQTELITDYSAALLLKYDSNTPSRLLPEDQANTILVDLPGQMSQETQAVNPNMNISDDIVPEVSSEDITVTDTTDSTGTTMQTGNGFEGLIGESGYSIEYSSYEIVDSYPEGDNSNAYFAMDASIGNKLLVVHFDLANTSGASEQVNMNQYSVKYRVVVNGEKTKKVMTTLLSNDILSYSGTLDSGDVVDLVAVTEISEEDAGNIQSLQFVIKGDEYKADINL